MRHIKSFKDFSQFVNEVSEESMRFTEMTREEYDKKVANGELKEGVGWDPPKNGRRYTMSEFANQIKDPKRRMEFYKDYHFPSKERPHPKSKHSSERTREPQKIVVEVPIEKISFWQKLVNIFKSNKDGKENMVGDSYEK